MKKLLVLVVLLAGCGYASSQGYDWVNTQLYSPMSATPQAVNVHVSEGESPDEIGADLATKRLVRNKEVFVWYVRYTGARSHLQAGDFVLNRNMNVPAIVDALQHGKVDQLALRMPEGYTLKLMAQQFSNSGLGSAADYEAAAGDVDGWSSRYDFLRNRPAGAPKNLEGFLFPESYELNKGSTAHDLVKRQLEEFAQAFPPDLRAQAGQPAPGRPPQSIYNIVILASIVEREVPTDKERARVCGVFYNRLEQHIRLDADATVLYALGKWKQTLTQDDLNVNSPYNTRKNFGLPPGPISNPGASSIKACLNPEKSDYIFYFTDPKGVTHFARTAAEFAQQQRQYGVAFQ